MVLTGIESVVQSLFDGGQNGLGRGRKTNLLQVFGKYSAVLLVVICLVGFAIKFLVLVKCFRPGTLE